jgi:hypothetical protein
MSLDATHLSSKAKGTMYIAMVKTALNEIYTVAFSIEHTNKCYDGWNSLLSHVKNACSLLKMKHPMDAHSSYGYFTFVSDRDKGLVQALKENYPSNHTTQFIIHIQHNVTTKYKGPEIQSDVYKIAKTFSYIKKRKCLIRLRNIRLQHMIIW